MSNTRGNNPGAIPIPLSSTQIRTHSNSPLRCERGAGVRWRSSFRIPHSPFPIVSAQIRISGTSPAFTNFTAFPNKFEKHCVSPAWFPSTTGSSPSNLIRALDACNSGYVRPAILRRLRLQRAMRIADCGLRNEAPGSSAGGAASGSGPGPYANHTGTSPLHRQTRMRAGSGGGRHHAPQPPDAVHRHTPAGGSWSRAAHPHPQAARGTPGAASV